MFDNESYINTDTILFHIVNILIVVSVFIINISRKVAWWWSYCRKLFNL